MSTLLSLYNCLKPLKNSFRQLIPLLGVQLPAQLHQIREPLGQVIASAYPAPDIAQNAAKTVFQASQENLHVLGGNRRFVAICKMPKTGKKRWFIWVF